jgi:hypothetical protein
MPRTRKNPVNLPTMAHPECTRPGLWPIGKAPRRIEHWFEVPFCLRKKNQPRKVDAQHRQAQRRAVSSLLIERPEFSNTCAESGAETGIQYSEKQCVLRLRKRKSQTGQRALAETATTRDFDQQVFHLASNSVFPT